eukprot:8475774-Alexandrium_andersonii.AAC.1
METPPLDIPFSWRVPHLVAPCGGGIQMGRSPVVGCPDGVSRLGALEGQPHGVGTPRDTPWGHPIW